MNKPSKKKKSPKNRSIGCGFVLPRTTLWIILSVILLLINLFISFLSLCEFSEPSAWRWVVCVFDLVLIIFYIVLFIFNVMEVRRNIWANKKLQTSKIAYANSIELRHSAIGIFCFLFLAIFWAVFMGIQLDSQFLITSNVTNYITLKVFYALNIVVIFVMIACYLDYQADISEQRIQKMETAMVENVAQ